MAGVLPLIKALGEPVRIRLYLLLKKTPLTVSELSHVLDLSQSNTSHHVKALRELDLLTAEKTGQHTYYALNQAQCGEPNIAAALALLEEASVEISEVRSDAVRLRTILAERSADTFTRWRMEQPDLPYSDIFAHLAGGRRGVVADIACGEGDFFENLALSFERVIAVDIDAAHVLRAAGRRGSDRVQVLQADAQTMPLAAESCDAVILRMALSQIPEPATALAEALRILKRGGYLSVIDSDNPQGKSLRKILQNAIAENRGIRLDVERQLPRLFMLRLQKI
ncbi:ArsR/SmtB family transcription factor [Turneriella parva]|uniref:Transcriptional regulator, ArsR family n=1 Tax=Turneriella parva (strain ATCC BAA-1111 / DSM 21527 / NCTC 11395 / H) TaxID=869212 RepID=I4B6N4_TURPD|nr:metalloregulator ArsR/SmtB family transcription factor [Turneriella parva]AFM12941.1 transcriptional regulator, ArsR family [Turneriella parva DSM 21527]